MKESYIAAKERWARKMAGKDKASVRSENRLPPGQRQQMLQVLQHGIPGMPRTLNDMMLAEFNSAAPGR